MLRLLAPHCSTNYQPQVIVSGPSTHGIPQANFTGTKQTDFEVAISEQPKPAEQCAKLVADVLNKQHFGHSICKLMFMYVRVCVRVRVCVFVCVRVCVCVRREWICKSLDYSAIKQGAFVTRCCRAAPEGYL